MRVKIGELKTHLSSYLRKLEEDGEALEVCVRERPVAYLVPVPAESGGPGKGGGAASVPTARLKAQGLLVIGAPAGPSKGKLPTPRLAGDRKSDVDSVHRMRSGRDW